MSRCVAALTTAAWLIAAGAALAGESSLWADEQSVLNQVQTDKRALFASNLKLDESESRAFWPIYDEYEREARKLDDRFLHLLNRFVEHYDALDDDAAREMLQEKLAIERERLALKDRYTAKIADVLPPKKALRYAQIETRVETIVRQETYSIIPLAR